MKGKKKMAKSVKRVLVVAKDRKGPKTEEGKWVVRFQYAKPGAAKPEWRTLICTENHPDYLLGLDLARQAGFRKFLRSRIKSDIEVVMEGV